MAENPRVLAVDDDKLIRMNLSLMLGREGLHVDTASSCVEARQLLGERRYGLVLTDLDLPDASGFDVIAAARELSPGSKVIILTGSASTLTAPSASEAGAEAIVFKPFTLEEILTLVKRSLGVAMREGQG